ncbi:MAG: C40 family peptidase [Chitinophagaceae bacterium]
MHSTIKRLGIYRYLTLSDVSLLHVLILLFMLASCASKKTSKINQIAIIKQDSLRIAQVSSTWIGVPYKYGGTSRQGIDCSALVCKIYETALQINLPRTTQAQAQYSVAINQNQLLPGDLIFFAINHNQISHVGLYLGANIFIHASSSKGVIESSLLIPYYTQRIKKYGRVLRK